VLTDSLYAAAAAAAVAVSVAVVQFGLVVAVVICMGLFGVMCIRCIWWLRSGHG
jgi:hypothetical protein